MEDLLQRNFGLKPPVKSAPMAASRSTRSSSLDKEKCGWNSTSSFFMDHSNEFFGSLNNQKNQNHQDLGVYDDVFGGPPKFTKPSESRVYDDFFEGFKEQGKSSSLPVFDKPLYDEDILESIPGLKSNSGVEYEDVFSSISSTAPSNSAAIDDLLGNFGRKDPGLEGQSDRRSGESGKGDSGFDELIPGFGISNPPRKWEATETDCPHETSIPSTKSASNILEDPFVVLESSPAPSHSSSGVFMDPLEHASIPTSSGSAKDYGPSTTGTIFNDINAFDGFPKSVPLFSSEANTNRKDSSPLRTGQHASPPLTTASREPNDDIPVMNIFENNAAMKDHFNNYPESQKTPFDMPRGSSDSRNVAGRSGFRISDANGSSSDSSPKSDDNLETIVDVWLTVVEVPLFTQPTSAPPPSRPPPPLVVKQASNSRTGKSSETHFDATRRVNEFSSFPQPSPHHQFPRAASDYGMLSGTPIDEQDDFATGKFRAFTNDRADVLLSEEDTETNLAAEAMERAGAIMRQAKEARERERDVKAAKTRESGWQNSVDKTAQEAQERERREKEEILERETEQREMEEKERERKRIEKEREDREKARMAVERATREARERAAAEARQRAERAAVEKANAEARARAGRAAVERATAEARERAAAEARGRAEKAAAEAREKERAEKTAAEARVRAANEARERASVERATADARARAERAAVERAYAEARERAAAAAKDKQQKNENDFESFFGMDARPNSATTQSTTTSYSVFDTQFQNGGGPKGVQRTSVGNPTGTSSNLGKASSAANIVDDLSSIFGAAPSSGEFQEFEGESEERRKARLDRHMRTAERTAKALAEKKERDIQTQREQAERHRFAETLDSEIKRWAAGKEGNLRALLSTLQYVLWPECGWQPVSLTDLIIGASVKKVYRKATLCIHPDKVQQKGANIQQKYIAEKVFDLLKEAWNKFNSEELF